jgi:hypothetical protein
VPGAVRPPSPEHKDPSENPSKRTRNAPRFQLYNPLVKANMVPEDLGQNQNFLRTSSGWLDRPSYAVRLPPRQNGKKWNRGSTLNFASPDLPIHSTNCSETLGVPGSPHGRPLPQRNCTETLSIMGNHKSRDQTSRTLVPTKTTKSESFPRVWRGQGHQEKRQKVLMCDSHTKFRKEMPPKLRH